MQLQNPMNHRVFECKLQAKAIRSRARLPVHQALVLERKESINHAEVGVQ